MRIIQLQQRTDYAIRILLFLAAEKRVMQTKQIAEAMAISPHLVPKLAQQMCRRGWLSSDFGKFGGYCLCCDPKTISLLDIITLMENKVKINRCLEHETYCNRNAISYCEVHAIYCGYQNLTERYLSSVTIADLMNPESLSAVQSRLREEMRGYELDFKTED